jgi:hypothetical protein
MRPDIGWPRCSSIPAAGGVTGPGGGAFGLAPGAIWRWDQMLAAGGGGRASPVRRGPKRASKLTPQLVDRIAGLDAGGGTLGEIAAATGISTFSVPNALGQVASRGSPQRPMSPSARTEGMVTRARALRFRWCRIRCP